MRRTLVALAMIFGCLVVASRWSAAAVLYAADGSAGHLSSLVILNQSTGAVTSIVGSTSDRTSRGWGSPPPPTR